MSWFCVTQAVSWSKLTGGRPPSLVVITRLVWRLLTLAGNGHILSAFSTWLNSPEPASVLAYSPNPAVCIRINARFNPGGTRDD